MKKRSSFLGLLLLLSGNVYAGDVEIGAIRLSGDPTLSANAMFEYELKWNSLGPWVSTRIIRRCRGPGRVATCSEQTVPLSNPRLRLINDSGRRPRYVALFSADVNADADQGNFALCGVVSGDPNDHDVSLTGGCELIGEVRLEPVRNREEPQRILHVKIRSFLD